MTEELTDIHDKFLLEMDDTEWNTEYFIQLLNSNCKVNPFWYY